MTLASLSFRPIPKSDLSNNSEISNYKKEIIECKWSQCQATAKSTKKQCKHCVSEEGDLYCYQHKD